jgi:hypothetical protein
MNEAYWFSRLAKLAKAAAQAHEKARRAQAALDHAKAGCGILERLCLPLPPMKAEKRPGRREGDRARQLVDTIPGMCNLCGSLHCDCDD